MDSKDIKVKIKHGADSSLEVDIKTDNTVLLLKE